MGAKCCRLVYELNALFGQSSKVCPLLTLWSSAQHLPCQLFWCHLFSLHQQHKAMNLH